MKKSTMMVISGLLFLSGHVTAAPVAPKNVSIKVNFNLEAPDQDGIVEQYTLKHAWTTAANNHRFITLQDKMSNMVGRYVILSRIERADEKDVTIKFAILDTSQSSALVNMPTMSVRYGQKGKMVITENNQKINLTVLATAK